MTEVPAVQDARPILEVSGVSLAFGGTLAVNDVSVAVSPGEILAVVGPNGAGKSSLAEIISGAMKPAGGKVVFNGIDVTRKPAYKVARLGLTRTYQMPTEFRQITVLENLLVGVPGQRGAKLRFALAGRRTWSDEEAQLRVKARGLLADFGLAAWEDAYAGSLSGGQRRILEIVRALMTEPKLLVLDEPTAGVTPSIVAEIERFVEVLRSRGLTFLIIEHELEFVERLADRVVVMAAGRVVADGTMAKLRLNPEVIDAYLVG
jgi:ABC-type branched-subunit amino acid transport system ATPase component